MHEFDQTGACDDLICDHGSALATFTVFRQPTPAHEKS